MHDLKDLLNGEQQLPTNDAMISKALEILDQSPNGQKLADFARNEKIDIRIIATPQPTTYLPETRVACIGFNKSHPVCPAHFVLMLAGILRESQQETDGIKHPDLDAPKEEHLKTSMAKYEDCVWYMCAVAVELSEQDAFTDYKFLDILREMGHSESIELFLKQERNG